MLNVELAPQAKKEAQNLLQQAEMAQRIFRAYIKGCHDQMGLDGDWNLSTDSWVFTEVKRENDAVD